MSLDIKWGLSVEPRSPVFHARKDGDGDFRLYYGDEPLPLEVGYVGVDLVGKGLYLLYLVRRSDVKEFMAIAGLDNMGFKVWLPSEVAIDVMGGDVMGYSFSILGYN